MRFEPPSEKKSIGKTLLGFHRVGEHRLMAVGLEGGTILTVYNPVSGLSPHEQAKIVLGEYKHPVITQHARAIRRLVEPPFLTFKSLDAIDQPIDVRALVEGALAGDRVIVPWGPVFLPEEQLQIEEIPIKTYCCTAANGRFSFLIQVGFDSESRTWYADVENFQEEE